MKNNVRLNFAIVLLTLFFIGCGKFSADEKNNSSKSNGVEDFVGTWDWDLDGKEQSFSVYITKNNNEITGRYTCIMSSGQRVDASIDEPSFMIPAKGNSDISVPFLHYYSGKMGKIHLVTDGKKLYWNVVEKPKDPPDFFLPVKATLLLRKS